MAELLGLGLGGRHRALGMVDRVQQAGHAGSRRPVPVPVLGVEWAGVETAGLAVEADGPGATGAVGAGAEGPAGAWGRSRKK